MKRLKITYLISVFLFLSADLYAQVNFTEIDITINNLLVSKDSFTFDPRYHSIRSGHRDTITKTFHANYPISYPPNNDSINGFWTYFFSSYSGAFNFTMAGDSIKIISYYFFPDVMTGHVFRLANIQLTFDGIDYSALIRNTDFVKDSFDFLDSYDDVSVYPAIGVTYSPLPIQIDSPTIMIKIHSKKESRVDNLEKNNFILYISGDKVIISSISGQPQSAQIQLFDALGRQLPLPLTQLQIPSGTSSQKLEVGNLSSGCYILRMKMKDQVISKSFVVTR